MALPSPTRTADLSRSSSPLAEPPLLTRLVAHFVASKRSLTSRSYVYRADEIVSEARPSIEDIAALSARNAFLRFRTEKQLRCLQEVRTGVGRLKEKGMEEFKSVLRMLDYSDARVKDTLHLLKTTPIEPSLQSKNPGSRQENDATSGVAEENSREQQHRCLHDFVLEQDVENLNRVFRECIDVTNEASSAFDESMDSFDHHIEKLMNLLSKDQPEDRPKQKFTLPREDVEAIGGAPVESTAALFSSLESHATEAAQHMQSLVRHYDLCITALKHTEGGGEAVEKAEANVGLDSVSENPLQTLNDDAPPEPMSEDERNEMMQVLEKDAPEVNDVVQELRDHVSEMELQHEQILTLVATLNREHERLNKAVLLLEELRQTLPQYTTAGSLFLESWSDQKAVIDSKMKDLEGMREFYEGFLNAYDGLILEIERRKQVRRKMDKIASDASAKIQKLFEDDVEGRENFMAEQGVFLPSDIYPCLVNPPVKFEIMPVKEDTDVLPDISPEAIQKALQRRDAELPTS